MTDRDTQDLERLVDTHGLAAVLDALRAIAHGKAEHVRANWQSPALALAWERIAGRLATVAGAAERRLP